MFHAHHVHSRRPSFVATPIMYCEMLEPSRPCSTMMVVASAGFGCQCEWQSSETPRSTSTMRASASDSEFWREENFRNGLPMATAQPATRDKALGAGVFRHLKIKYATDIRRLTGFTDLSSLIRANPWRSWVLAYVRMLDTEIKQDAQSPLLGPTPVGKRPRERSAFRSLKL